MFCICFHICTCWSQETYRKQWFLQPWPTIYAIAQLDNGLSPIKWQPMIWTSADSPLKRPWRPISTDKYSLHIGKLSWYGIIFYGNSIKIPKFYPRKHPSNYCSKFCCGWEMSQRTPFMNIVKRNIIQNQDILIYMFVPNTPWPLHVVGVSDFNGPIWDTGQRGPRIHIKAV